MNYITTFPWCQGFDKNFFGMAESLDFAVVLGLREIAYALLSAAPARGSGRFGAVFAAFGGLQRAPLIARRGQQAVKPMLICHRITILNTVCIYCVFPGICRISHYCTIRIIYNQIPHQTIRKTVLLRIVLRIWEFLGGPRPGQRPGSSRRPPESDRAWPGRTGGTPEGRTRGDRNVTGTPRTRGA